MFLYLPKYFIKPSQALIKIFNYVRVHILDPAALATSSQALHVFWPMWRRSGRKRYKLLLYIKINPKYPNRKLLYLTLRSKISIYRPTK